MITRGPLLRSVSPTRNPHPVSPPRTQLTLLSSFHGGFDRVLRFASFYVQQKPASHFQRSWFHHRLNTSERMNSTNHTVGAVNRKKQKLVTSMWRPVSTQATSAEEQSSSLQNQLEEASGEEVLMSTEVVSEETDLTSSTNLTEENSRAGALEGESSRHVEMHSLRVEVGSSLMRFIKGKEGATQRKIEEEMDVKIIFPSSKKDDFIVIKGISLVGVTRASESIQAIIEEAVNSRSFPYSHFVSLPLAIHPELVIKLVDFQNTIMGTADLSVDENSGSDSAEDNEDKEQRLKKACNVSVEAINVDSKHAKVNPRDIPLVSYAPKTKTFPDPRIERSIFIKPKTFHLTVLMLKLWKKEQVNAAVKVLKNVSPEVMSVLDNRPVFIRLKGLDCMKGSLSKARVVYATVEEITGKDRLVRACDVIINAFKQAGLVLENDATQKLKLHATLMNVLHRKGRAKKKHDSFDARGIFEQFGSHDWGEYLIREAHLSQRFVYDNNGYYHCCTSIPFPESKPVE